MRVSLGEESSNNYAVIADGVGSNSVKKFHEDIEIRIYNDYGSINDRIGILSSRTSVEYLPFIHLLFTIIWKLYTCS